jgi:hypothetical protein
VRSPLNKGAALVETTRGVATATKLFSVNMTNFEWDKKECVLDAESGSQV